MTRSGWKCLASSDGDLQLQSEPRLQTFCSQNVALDGFCACAVLSGCVLFPDIQDGTRIIQRCSRMACSKPCGARCDQQYTVDHTGVVKRMRCTTPVSVLTKGTTQRLDVKMKETRTDGKSQLLAGIGTEYSTNSERHASTKHNTTESPHRSGSPRHGATRQRGTQHGPTPGQVAHTGPSGTQRTTNTVCPPWFACCIHLDNGI